MSDDYTAVIHFELMGLFCKIKKDFPELSNTSILGVVSFETLEVFNSLLSIELKNKENEQ